MVGYLEATFLPVILKTNFRVRRHPGAMRFLIG
jgi:hypothetical protein